MAIVGAKQRGQNDPTDRLETAAIDVEHVSMRFDGGVQALAQVNLSIRRGEFISIVGPSGCGKSTLLRIIAGLIAPSDGTVLINDSPVTGPRPDVGVMFQRPTLLPWRTSLENVLLPVGLTSRPNSEDADKAHDLLTMVGLNGFEHAYPAHLSGGMQQRVALARLLMVGADILLLDEPFGALDEFTREHLNDKLLEIKEATGATMVLVTHSISESVILADRIVAMTPRPGQISREIIVPFGRPRTAAVVEDKRFQETTLDVRSAFTGIGEIR